MAATQLGGFITNIVGSTFNIWGIPGSTILKIAGFILSYLLRIYLLRISYNYIRPILASDSNKKFTPITYRDAWIILIFIEVITDK